LNSGTAICAAYFALCWHFSVFAFSTPCAAHKICELNLYLKFPPFLGNWQAGSKLPNKPKHFVCTNLRLTFGLARSSSFRSFSSFSSLLHHWAASILFITENFKLELKF